MSADVKRTCNRDSVVRVTVSQAIRAAADRVIRFDYSSVH
jgi:hypothetical protein